VGTIKVWVDLASCPGKFKKELTAFTNDRRRSWFKLFLSGQSNLKRQ
jgi:hypothetical protein